MKGIHESCSRGNLQTFSQLNVMANKVPSQEKVLKVESLDEIERLSIFPSLSLVLVKMTSPYLPASPKVKLEKKVPFNVLLIHPEDWKRVSFRGRKICENLGVLL